MASQAAVKRVDGVLKPVGKRGRPPGARNRTPEEKRLKSATGQIDYLRWHNIFQKAADFYVYLAGYPDKTGLLATVYRLIPRIDVTLIGGDETGIMKTASEAEMNEETVGATFGRGKYMLILNDGNRPSGQREVAKTWFDLTSHPKPPVYDPRTLVLSEQKNIDEINRLVNIGVMVRDRATGQVRVKVDGDGMANGVLVEKPAAAPNPLGGLDLGAILTHVLTQNSRAPGDAVKDTIEVARLMRESSTPPVDVEAVVERVVSRLTVKGGGGLDALETYTKVDNLLAKFRGAPAAENGDHKKTRDRGIGAWGPYLPSMFAELRALVPEVAAAWRDMRGGNGGGQQDVSGQQQQLARPKSMQDRIGEICTMGFAKMNEGVKGFDFAAYVCGFHPGGLEVFRHLEPHGAAGLVGLLAMHPQGRELVNDPNIRPHIDAFLDDFFQFDPDGVLDAGESAPPAGAGAAG